MSSSISLLHISFSPLILYITYYGCRFGHVYHNIQPRVTKTLLHVFLDPSKLLPQHYGAVQGLSDLGPSVVNLFANDLMYNEGRCHRIYQHDYFSFTFKSRMKDCPAVLENIVNLGHN